MKHVAIAALVAVPVAAHAGKLTLDPGGVIVSLTAEISASSGAVAKPASIAPDLSVGVAPDLMLSLVTSTYGTTGFRGGTGDGVCMTGASDGCPHAFNNVGGEAVYALSDGIAAVGGLYSLNIDGSFVDLKLGAKTKYTSGAISIMFNPSLYAGLDRRATNTDQLYLPVGLSYKVAAPLAVGVGSGIKGPLGGFSKFGAAYTVPLGVNAVVTATTAVAVGASFTFGKLVGGPSLAPDTTGADFRGIHVWLTYTR